MRGSPGLLGALLAACWVCASPPAVAAKAVRSKTSQGKKKPKKPVCPKPEPCPEPEPCPACAACPECPGPDAGSGDTGQDVVETIDDGSSVGAPETPEVAPAAKPSPAPPAAAPTSAPGDKLEAQGWTRVEGRYGLWREPSSGSDPLAVPYDRVEGHGLLSLRLSYQRGRSFALVASGLLHEAVFWRTQIAPDGSSRVRDRFEGSLREAYLGVFFSSLDVRVGQQRVVWGRSDLFTINDVVNATDLRDPFLAESEALHVPTLLLRADADFDPMQLQFVFAPIFQRSRFDLYGGNWAAVQPSVAGKYRGLVNLMSQLVDTSLENEAAPLFMQTSLPTGADGFAGGLRYNVSGEGIDFALYYHYGFVPTPELTVEPWFSDLLGTLDYSVMTPYDLRGIIDLAQARGAPLKATYVHRHHVGFDLGGTVGSFALKLEGAFDSKAFFYTVDLASYGRPTVQGVASVEYQTGEVGKAVILELWYQRLIDPPDVALIGVATDSLAAGLVARWTFAEHLEVEIRSVVGIKPFGYLARPQLAWKQGGFSVRVGALLVGGSSGTAGDYFSRNQAAYLAVRQAF